MSPICFSKSPICWNRFVFWNNRFVLRICFKFGANLFFLANKSTVLKNKSVCKTVKFEKTNRWFHTANLLFKHTDLFSSHKIPPADVVRLRLPCLVLFACQARPHVCSHFPSLFRHRELSSSYSLVIFLSLSFSLWCVPTCLLVHPT